MSPNPTLYSQPFSPLSPPESEGHQSSAPNDAKPSDFALSATTFPPSPPVSFPSTSPQPAHRTHKSSVSSIDDLDLGPVTSFEPGSALADASALSGHYLARYLHYRQVALAGAENDQQVNDILSAYAVDAPPQAAGPFTSITSMDQAYHQRYPAVAPAPQVRQVFIPQHDLYSRDPQSYYTELAQSQQLLYPSGIPSHVQISSLSASPLSPASNDAHRLSPKTDSQRATLMQPMQMSMLQQHTYSQYYTPAAPRAAPFASSGIAWDQNAPAAYMPQVPLPVPAQPHFSFPTQVQANASAASNKIQLRLPQQPEIVSNYAASSNADDELEDNETEETLDSSRETSSSLDLRSVSSIPNIHGGGRGYIRGATEDDPKKRHKCDVCGRGFARAFNLKVCLVSPAPVYPLTCQSHAQTHDPLRPKPHMCPHPACKRGFSRLHDLERHRQGIHADGPLVDAKRQNITPSVARAQSRIQRRAERGNLI